MLSVDSPSNDSEKVWANKLYKCFKLIQTLESKQTGDLPLFADILMPVAESFAVKYDLKRPSQDNETVSIGIGKVDVVSIETINVPSRR